MSDGISAEDARRMLEAATPGPWEAHTDHQGPKVWPTLGGGVDCYIADCDPLHAGGNAALIAAAPTLAATVIALERERAEMLDALNGTGVQVARLTRERDEALAELAAEREAHAAAGRFAEKQGALVHRLSSEKAALTRCLHAHHNDAKRDTFGLFVFPAIAGVTLGVAAGLLLFAQVLK
jgi:hypothetical protein